MATATPYKTIVPGIHQLQVPIPNNPLGYVLPYLMEGSDGYTLIDSGWNAPEAYGAPSISSASQSPLSLPASP